MSKTMMKNKMISSFNKYNKEIKLVRKDNRILADKKLIKVEEEQLVNLINHNHLMMIQRDLLLNKTNMMRREMIHYIIKMMEECLMRTKNNL